MAGLLSYLEPHIPAPDNDTLTGVLVALVAMLNFADLPG